MLSILISIFFGKKPRRLTSGKAGDEPDEVFRSASRSGRRGRAGGCGPGGRRLQWQQPPVFTTTYSGHLYAFNAATGATLLNTPLSAGSNAPVTIDGGYVIAGAAVPLSGKALIIAYKLGAHGKLPHTVRGPGVAQAPRAARTRSRISSSGRPAASSGRSWMVPLLVLSPGWREVKPASRPCCQP